MKQEYLCNIKLILLIADILNSVYVVQFNEGNN